MGMYAMYESQIGYRAIGRVFGVYDINLEHDDENGMCWMTRKTLHDIQDIRDRAKQKLMICNVPRDPFDENVIKALREHYLDIILLARKLEEAFGAMANEHRNKWEAQTGKSIQDNWELVDQEIESLNLYFV